MAHGGKDQVGQQCQNGSYDGSSYSHQQGPPLTAGFFQCLFQILEFARQDCDLGGRCRQGGGGLGLGRVDPVDCPPELSTRSTRVVTVLVSSRIRSVLVLAGTLSPPGPRRVASAFPPTCESAPGANRPTAGPDGMIPAPAPPGPQGGTWRPPARRTRDGWQR